MAQYRRTFNSLGGPTRIADPGADELARMVALQLQRQGQADQAAQHQAKLSLEERLAMDAGRRDDARLAADMAHNQQQAALAQQAYGLNERRLGVDETQGNRAHELALRAALQGDTRIGLERDDLGLRREQLGEQRADRTSRETGRREDKRDDAKRWREEFDYKQRADKTDAEDRRLEAALGRTAAVGRSALEHQLATMRDNTQFAREDARYADAMGRQTKAEADEAKRQAILAGAESVGGDHALKYEVPDPGLFGFMHNPQDDVPELVQAINASFGTPTTEGEVLETYQAIKNEFELLFQRAAEEQRNTRFGIDNSASQQDTFARALRELERTAAAHSRRVQGGPGPTAPKAPEFVRKPK
jgi:hypothetical protein